MTFEKFFFVAVYNGKSIGSADFNFILNTFHSIAYKTLF